MRSADPFRKLDVGDANPMIYVNRSESSEFVYSDICPTSRHTYGKADPCERSTRVENKQLQEIRGEEKNGEQRLFLLLRSPPNFTILFFGCFFSAMVFFFFFLCFFSFFEIKGHASSPSLFCAKLVNSTSNVAKQQE